MLISGRADANYRSGGVVTSGVAPPCYAGDISQLLRAGSKSMQLTPCCFTLLQFGAQLLPNDKRPHGRAAVFVQEECNSLGVIYCLHSQQPLFRSVYSR